LWGLIFNENELIDNDALLRVILFTVTVTLLLFVAGINLYFLYHVDQFINIYLRDNKFKKYKPQDVYKKAEETFKEVSKSIHSVGSTCYALDVIIIVIYLNVKHPGTSLLVSVIFIILGILAGCAWNIRGYFGDRRIDWGNIFKKKLDSVNLRSVRYNENNFNSMNKIKIKYTIYHSISNIVYPIVIFSFFIALVFIPFGEESIWGMLIEQPGSKGTYSFFVFAFVTAFLFYIKQLYPLFYSNKMKEQNLYCDITKMFD